MRIYANFKSFHTKKTTTKYLKKLDDFVQNMHIKDDIAVCVPSCAFKDYGLKNNIKIAAQNFYPAYEGSYTGEITLLHLKSSFIENVLIGHSERREILGEEQSFVARKFNFAKESNLKIIYCIGEPLAIREMGFEKIKEYLLGEFEGIDTSYKNFCIAYEPIWAIGSGSSAKIEQIQEILDMLKGYFNKDLLYGGSVNDKNAKEILSLKNCDGVLIGSYALEVENLCKILEISQNLKI